MFFKYIHKKSRTARIQHWPFCVVIFTCWPTIYNPAFSPLFSSYCCSYFVTSVKSKCKQVSVKNEKNKCKKCKKNSVKNVKSN